MREVRFIILLLSGFVFGAHFSWVNAQDVAAIMNKALEAYKKSNGLTAEFTMTVNSEIQENTGSFEGVIDIRGDKFVLKTPDVITWYDGENQWSYLERTQEVNLTIPEGKDLQMTNPSYLLRSYDKGFKASLKGKSTAPNGKACYDIILEPKVKSDIRHVSLQIEKNSGLPASINFDMRNGANSSIHVTRVVTGVKQPDCFFIFNENDYPEAELIDLR